MRTGGNLGERALVWVPALSRYVPPAVDSPINANGGNTVVLPGVLLMNASDETVAWLGSPLWVRSTRCGRNPSALIALWKHGDARVETNAVDALRGGHAVRQCGGSGPARPIAGGSVGVLAADRWSNFEVEG